MKLTLSIIKADIGSVDGHIALSQDLLRDALSGNVNTGAYSVAYATQFNGFPCPDTVVLQHAVA